MARTLPRAVESVPQLVSSAAPVARPPASLRDHADGPESFPVSKIPAVNVASVPQRSPLRYPGGKTWLIPHLRAWLAERSPPPVFVEPFCGGAIVALTAVMEGFAPRGVLIELDRDVAAFWHTALCHADTLCERVLSFHPTRENVKEISETPPADLVDHGFRTLVINRTRRGGILAPGASLTRIGENGKGVASRWYPETIVNRLRAISAFADRIAFCESDGVKVLESMALVDGVAIFVDPPYTVGGKKAGRRLYAHHDVDHRRIFEILDDSGADFLMTYDASPEVIRLVRHHGFSAASVLMKNTHHARLRELVITRRPRFAVGA